MSDKPVRHLLGISGGKDSAALAIYMRDKVPEMEYFFADTGAELIETLEFVDLMETYLGKKITRINAGRDFDYYLKLNGNMLPTARSRWCTINLKLKPFERFVGDDQVISYVALRADEPYRTGYISTKPNIKACYPFKEDGLDINDVKNILERHPDLFEKAKDFELYHKNLGRSYTWSQDESLEDMVARKDEIKAQFALSQDKPKKLNNLMDVLSDDEDDDEDGCLVCFK